MSFSSKGLAEFVAEATEILDTLSQDLLMLDERRGQEPDPELVNGIFRAAHSLKGLSGMFGQDRVAQLAHCAEDLLDRLRLGKVTLDDVVIDGLIASLDVFQHLLAEASRNDASDTLTRRADELGGHLLALSGPELSAEVDPLDSLGLDSGVRTVLTEYEEHRLRENLRKGQRIYRVRAAFDLSDFDHRLAELNARLKPLGEVVSTLPSSEPGEGTKIAFDLLFGTRREGPEIEAAIAPLPAHVSMLKEVAPPAGVRMHAVPQHAPARALRPATQDAQDEDDDETTPSGARPRVVEVGGRTAPTLAPFGVADTGARLRVEGDSSLRSLTQTVRVDIRRLDALMNAVGELLLTKANLQRMADSARQGGVQTQSKLWAQELYRETRQLERKLDELQKGILDVRMVPLGQVFDKLARLVRRNVRETGKEIDLDVTGGDVELDKLIVEELSDPLMHIIRNAIDHGIEPADERVRKGKPRRGTISLRATQQGNHVVIEIRDDGPGIDERRVREVAVSRGLIPADQAETLTRRELQNLVFLPGFSTARAVSDLSGRGVGLDVVKTNIANLSGIIDLHSEPELGTSIAVTLPLTLAIIRALVVAASGRTYAVPLNSVLEIIAVEEGDVRTIERREVVTLRGQTLPLTRLSRLFGLPARTNKQIYVVVVGLAQQRLGIAVDELMGQQDIVTKPLGGRLRNVRGISGATDLGNRRTVLVLDVGELVEEVLMPERRAENA